MAKGTSWAKDMSSSEKIKPIALAIAELLTQSVSRKFG